MALSRLLTGKFAKVKKSPLSLFSLFSMSIAAGGRIRTFNEIHVRKERGIKERKWRWINEEDLKWLK